MTELTWRQNAIDIASLFFAAVLCMAPSMFGFATDQPAASNAWLSGLAIAVVSLMALLKFAMWEEWINLALGLWVAVSPLVLGFAARDEAVWVHVVVGLIVAGLAAVALWWKAEPPHAAAH